MRRSFLALALLLAGCDGGGNGGPVPNGNAVPGGQQPFMTRPDPAQSLASCEQPAGTIGAPDLVADPLSLPDRGNGLSAGAVTDAPANLPLRAIRTQIASAVDLIIQIGRLRDGSRKLLSITEVCGLEGEVITMNDVFAFEFEGDDSQGKVKGSWVSPKVRPGFYDRLEYFGLANAWMQALQES